MSKILEAENAIKQALETELEPSPITAEKTLAKIYLEMAHRLVSQARALVVSGAKDQAESGAKEQISAGR